VRRVGTDGVISTVIGDGFSGTAGLEGPASAAQVYYPHGVALDATGRLHIADLYNRVLRIEPPLPSFTVGAIFVPASDGSELYEFDPAGRHLRTFDTNRLGTTPQAIDDATLLTIDWDEDGLVSVTDADDNIVAVERDAQGVPTAITGPFGDQTTLTQDANGWLNAIIDPASGDHEFVSSAGGLLATYTTPEEHAYAFTYDTDGRLERDDDPAGGFKTLTRTDVAGGWNVDVTTALGRTRTYGVLRPEEGVEIRTSTDAAGLTTTTTRDAKWVEETVSPTGVTAVATPAPNPFQGLAACGETRRVAP